MSNKKNIWDYDDEYLMQCSLGEIIKIINEVELFVTSQHFASLVNFNGLVDLTEIIPEIYNKITIIRGRLFEDQFSETLPKNWKSKKDGLLTKLFYALIVIQHYRDYYRLSTISDTAFQELGILKESNRRLEEDYDSKKADLEDKIKHLEETTDKTLEEQNKAQESFKETITEQTNAIKQTSKETQKEIKATEGKIVSHVLTLMGIFSAVITIILSVTVTSTSWLNNASSSSAIVAFVIPNMVTLVAVISIVLLIYMYQKVLYPPTVQEGEKPNKAPTIISIILLVVFLIITIFMSVLAYRSFRAEPHSRYVISESEYVVMEKQDSNTDEAYKYIEFVFEGQSYEFAYDESYFHDSNLYYCPVHNTLE